MTQATMLTSADVRQSCGGVSDMTIFRWLRDERANFPRPVYVNRRRYWRADEISQWWKTRSAEAPPAPQRRATVNA